MEITRLRTLWKGNDLDLMSLWLKLVNLGHQRFKIEYTHEQNSWLIDIFLPEVLKYGLPKENTTWRWKDSFLWPRSEEGNLLRPVFIEDMGRIIMFLDVNYYGIYYDPDKKIYRPYKIPNLSVLSSIYKFNHTRILRDLGIPFDVFQDNPQIWPTTDLNQPNNPYKYYFRKTSEV